MGFTEHGSIQRASVKKAHQFIAVQDLLQIHKPHWSISNNEPPICQPVQLCADYQRTLLYWNSWQFYFLWMTWVAIVHWHRSRSLKLAWQFGLVQSYFFFFSLIVWLWLTIIEVWSRRFNLLLLLGWYHLYVSFTVLCLHPDHVIIYAFAKINKKS